MANKGQSIRRFEDPRFLKGQGSYVGNINLPGMAHAVIVRSPHAHATINGINTSAASAMPGVLGVFTGQDLIDGGCGSLPSGWNVPEMKVPSHYPLTADKVRHVGDSVAVVVAENGCPSSGRR